MAEACAGAAATPWIRPELRRTRLPPWTPPLGSELAGRAGHCSSRLQPRPEPRRPRLPSAVRLAGGRPELPSPPRSGSGSGATGRRPRGPRPRPGLPAQAPPAAQAASSGQWALAHGVSFLCAPADTLRDDASLRSTTPSEPDLSTGF